MKKVGWILWAAFVVAIGAYLVATNWDALRDFFLQLSFKQLWDSFLQLSRVIQIIIGFVVWLISVIVPAIVVVPLFAKKSEEGGWLYYWAYLFLWPPAWPLGVILLFVILIGKLWSR